MLPLILIKFENGPNEFFFLFLFRPPMLTCCEKIVKTKNNQRTNGPVNAHLISWPSKAQNIPNLDNIW